ncbi:MAG: TIM barrel protein [Verrucomicrobiota bacterium]
MKPNPIRTSTPITRRSLLKGAAALAAASALVGRRALAADAAPAATKGRIKHSIVKWCFETAGSKWDIEQMCEVAKQLGCVGVELTSVSDYAVLKRHGLTCAIAQIDMNPAPPFLYGFNNPANWPRVIKATTEAIDAAAVAGVPSVICFTGYSALDPKEPKGGHLSLEQGAKNCVEGFKKVIDHAERKEINLCLEMLNSREDTHPMKGHPGYQGDHTDYCIDIIKRVGSPRMKLLLDIYHVQVQDGDIIRRIRQFHPYIGHVHTAGNPGRGELDNKQEINFPPIMEALVAVGYKGYVGHEFIPTRDALQGLREAVTLCDV